MDWLFEGRVTLYAALLLSGLVLLALWYRDRKTLWLTLLTVPAALALLYFLLDKWVETPREQITRKLNTMADAVAQRDPATIGTQLAATFRLGTNDRKAFLAFTEKVLAERWVDSLTLWEIQTDPKEAKAEAVFKAKLRGQRVGGEEFFLVKTQWTREGDQWRLAGFTVHHPFVNVDQPLDIPGLP
jgi:hypothetical protein